MQEINKNFIIKHWGLIDYPTAYQRQEILFNEISNIKLYNKTLVVDQQKATPNYLVFCEHPPIYTLGRAGNKDHLLINDTELHRKGVAFFYTNRGGDITYHGPGQLVVYLIIDLENFFMDIHLYLRLLEKAVICTLQDFKIDSNILKGFTGVWLDSDSIPNARKICAIGVRLSRWITMHGLALNVYNDLIYFKYIVPCGIEASKVTSMQVELGYKPAMQAVADSLAKNLIQIFTLT